MAVTAKTVMELREKTGAGMMTCKKALQETGGDLEQAFEYLRKKGVETAKKKSARTAEEGVVKAKVESGRAVMLEVVCETDFVAKNDQFQEFTDQLLDILYRSGAEDLEGFKAYSAEEFGGKTVQEKVTENIANIGENISVTKIAVIKFDPSSANVIPYIHMNGKIGVLTEVAAPSPDSDVVIAAAKDVAMQVAAMNPKSLSADELDRDFVDKERSILLEQMKNDEKNKNKPEEILNKIIDGRLGKLYKEVCLLEQPFVKENKKSVSEFIKGNGTGMEIKSFIRFEAGE
ncbi:MAG: translation elongation factor Ts [Fibrobacterota bacterium]